MTQTGEYGSYRNRVSAGTDAVRVAGCTAGESAAVAHAGGCGSRSTTGTAAELVFAPASTTSAAPTTSSVATCVAVCVELVSLRAPSSSEELTSDLHELREELLESRREGLPLERYRGIYRHDIEEYKDTI